MKHTSHILRFVSVLIAFALLASACSAASSVSIEKPDSETEETAAENTNSATTSDSDSESGTSEGQDSEPEPAATVEAPASSAAGRPEPTATAEAEPTATPKPEPTATPEPEQDGEETLDWRPCPNIGTKECATLTVPVDYDDPSLGELNLSVAISRATDPDKRIGYLFLNPGGPGGSAVEFAEYLEFVGLPDVILESFDVVGLDPRGVELSEPQFACGDKTEQFDILQKIEGHPDTEEEIQFGFDAAQTCIDSMGPVASRLGTEYLAHDIDEMRKALGAKQISFLGFSYGSTVGAWYATRFPDNVRAMVIDGAGDPTLRATDLETAIELQRLEIGPFEEQIGAALDACDNDECPIYNNGNPRQYWIDTAPKFELVQKAGNNDISSVYLGIFGFLYTESTWPELWQAVYDLNVNDDPAGFIASVSRAGVAAGEASFTGHVNCLDMWSLFDDMTTRKELDLEAELEPELDRLAEEEFPLFMAVDLEDQSGPCTFFEHLDVKPLGEQLDGNGVDILVIGNTTDPVTPFVQSERFATEVLDKGHLVRVPHPKHVVYPGNSCVNDIVEQVLIDQQYPDDIVDCDREDVDIPDPSETEFEAATLADGSAVMVPKGWTAIDESLYVRGAGSEDETGLLLLPFESADMIYALITSEFDDTKVKELEPFEFDGATWNTYAVDDASDGTYLRFTTLDDTPSIGLAIFGSEAEIDDLYEHILKPVAASYVPNS